MVEPIVILTASTIDDGGVAKVIALLDDTPTVVLDSSRFPLDAHLALDLDGGLWIDGVDHPLRSARAIWHRHLDIAGALGDRLDPLWRPAVERQSALALAALVADLPGLHVDHPDRAEAVPGTPGILRLGRAAGLDVPRTLVSNHPGRIREFVAGCPHGAIRKMLHSSSVIIQTAEGETRGTTVAVDPAELDDDNAVAACPLVWQEKVEKARELRVTAVGRQLFVASVDSQGSDRGSVDWRQDPALVRAFAPDALPAPVEAAVHRLLDRLALNFATLDIIATPDGRHVLLEVNTTSFFDFVEEATGLPIAAAVADLLRGRIPPRVR